MSHAGVTDMTCHNRASRIMQQNGIDSHRSGRVSAGYLSDVTAHVPMIRDVVSRGTMPPWCAAKPAGGHGSIWANGSSPSEADKSGLITWIEGGQPEGERRDLGDRRPEQQVLSHICAFRKVCNANTSAIHAPHVLPPTHAKVNRDLPVWVIAFETTEFTEAQRFVEGDCRSIGCWGGDLRTAGGIGIRLRNRR